MGKFLRVAIIYLDVEWECLGNWREEQILKSFHLVFKLEDGIVGDLAPFPSVPRQTYFLLY